MQSGNAANTGGTLLTISRSLTLTLALTLVSGLAHAAEPLTDVRVLIDVSGSMKDNDPANLRVPALRLLTGLMPAGARTGIWTFAESIDLQVAPVPVDEAWKQQANAAAAAIHSRGQRTDIETALRVASTGWGAADPEVRRSVILLTDGMVDTGDADASSASRRRILAERIDALVGSGAAIHVIALSAQADHELLRTLAVRSGGWYERAEDASQLERLFLRMFEKATAPDTVPITGNRFGVDASIDEMTVLVFRAPEAPPMRLLDPEAKAHDPSNPAPGFSWRTGNGYDMVTINAPLRGEWQIEAEVDPDNRVMVVTDLRLEVGALPSYLLPGKPLLVVGSLSEHGQRVVRGDFLRLVGMSSSYLSAGDSRDLVMLDDGEGGDSEAEDGEFGVTLDIDDNEGIVDLMVTADSGTFVREKRFSLEVVWPVAVQLTAEPPRSLVLTPRPEMIDPATVQVAARWASADPQAPPLPVTGEADRSLRVALGEDDRGGDLLLDVTATMIDGTALELRLPKVVVPAPAARPGQPDTTPADASVALPAAAEPGAAEPTGQTTPTGADAEPADWTRAAVMTAVANLLAGLALGGSLWWHRRRTRRVLLGCEAALAPAG